MNLISFRLASEDVDDGVDVVELSRDEAWKLVDCLLGQLQEQEQQG